MDIKFQVYYASSPSGPWTLSNAVPIDHVEGSLQEHTVSGLVQDATYYFAIVGGVVEDGEFLPFITQPLSPTANGVRDVDQIAPNLIAMKAYVPKQTTDASLGHQFTVT